MLYNRFHSYYKTIKPAIFIFIMYFKLNLLAFMTSFFIAIIISLITIPIPQIISTYPNINDTTIYYDRR